jgi:hypothetical protein
VGDQRRRHQLRKPTSQNAVHELSSGTGVETDFSLGREVFHGWPGAVRPMSEHELRCRLGEKTLEALFQGSQPTCVRGVQLGHGVAEGYPQGKSWG